MKIIVPGTEEAEIYDKLHQLSPANPNHTLPCEVAHSPDGRPPILIMPALEKLTNFKKFHNLSYLLSCYDQVLEVGDCRKSHMLSLNGRDLRL